MSQTSEREFNDKVDELVTLALSCGMCLDESQKVDARKLRQELNELFNTRPSAQWVKVEDLPDEEQRVIVYYDYHYVDKRDGTGRVIPKLISFGRWMRHDDGFTVVWDIEENEVNITHTNIQYIPKYWMPLPNPPAENAGQEASK